MSNVESLKDLRLNRLTFFYPQNEIKFKSASITDSFVLLTFDI